uniref:Uncharacterized protein n=1 Tax=Oryza nivara TaxID=4536 RepID=A0A0E0FSY0_ORYNI
MEMAQTPVEWGRQEDRRARGGGSQGLSATTDDRELLDNPFHLPHREGHPNSSNGWEKDGRQDGGGRGIAIAEARGHGHALDQEWSSNSYRPLLIPVGT